MITPRVVRAIATVGVATSLTAGFASRRAVATDNAITAADLRTRLEAFAHDSMRGRMAGSPDGARAVRMLDAEVRRLGLRPAGDSMFTQTVPAVRVALDTLGASFFGVENEPYHYGTDLIPVVGLGGLPFRRDARETNREVIFAGRLGSRDAVSPDKLINAVVVMLPPQRDDREPDYQIWNPQYADALAAYRRSAMVLFPILDLMPRGARALLGRPQLEPPGSAPPSRFPPIVAVSHAVASRSIGAAVYGARPGQFVPKNSVALEFETKRSAPRSPVQNVVGVIEGSDPQLKSQVVLLVAHSDGLGVDDRRAEPGEIYPLQSDSILNGADAGGSGAVALLEIAEYIASLAVKPKRTVMFLWSGAELHDAIGTKWFAEHMPRGRGAIVAAIVVDRLGRTHDDTLSVTGAVNMSAEMHEWIAGVNERSEFRFVTGDAGVPLGDGPASFCAGGQAEFARRGIPTAYVAGGVNDDTHTVRDETSQINYDALARATRFIAAIAREIADRPAKPMVENARIGC